MYVYVFKGAERLMGFTVSSGGNNLPAAHGPWVLLTRLQMTEEDVPRPIVQTTECLEDLEMYGFHITDSQRRVKDALEH